MLSLRIALRYLLSRKQFGAVNIISAISLAAVAVAAAAMVIVLSVFNGFEQLAQSKLSAFDPPYLLVPVKGKVIPDGMALAGQLEELDGVESVEPEISEQAFVVAPSGQMPVVIKGMTEQGIALSGIGRTMVDGTQVLSSDNSALLSVGVAIQLGLRPTAGLDSFTIYEPRRVGNINPANPMAAFRRSPCRATGVFQCEQEEYDRDVVVVPFQVAARLLSYQDEATALAVYTPDDGGSRQLERALSQFAGEHGLEVKDRYRQQEQAFRMIAIEKWITFVMLAFILLIASANIISTLSMLVIDKQPNMAILRAMGADGGFIRRVFCTQGWLIVVCGGMAGIIAGALLVLGQTRFGWVKLGGTNPALLSVDSYPVVLQPSDIGVATLAVVAAGVLLTPVVALIVRRTASAS